MQFFLDSTDLEEIKMLNSFGIIDGLTTNPSLIYKSKTPFKLLIKKLCDEILGPVSVETVAENSNQMIKEGIKLSKMAKNIVVKLPMTWEGLKACRELSMVDIKTNITLCFSTSQALLAAKAGSTYVSPFIGRLDDENIDGVELIKQIKKIYTNYSYSTKILAASVRHTIHIINCAKVGSDVMTGPLSAIKGLLKHPLTLCSFR